MPEDFVVKEITQRGTVLEPYKAYGSEGSRSGNGEGPFSVFVLQKRNWNTLQALKSIAKAHGRGLKSMGFAGTKDRASISVQLCSVFGSSPEEIMRTNIKDISINGAWKSAEGLKLGDLLGNRFAVKIRQASNPERIPDIENALGGVFPNYYGAQRFGYRADNVEIGLSMLRGNYRKAVLMYLTDVSGERMEESASARKRLADDLDFQEAMRYFPKHLKYERSVIDYLARFPGSYSNALKKLPRHLALMFIHSVESYIFNTELAERIRQNRAAPEKGDYVCERNPYGFPDVGTTRRDDRIGDTAGTFAVGNIVGYGTEELTEVEKEAMEKLGLSLEMFKLKGMPELSSKGTFRPLFAPYLGFRFGIEDYPVFEFSLPNGSYATSLLREFIDDSQYPKQ